MIPCHVVDQSGLWEELGKPIGGEKDIPGCREKTARRLQRAVLADKLDAKYAGPRVLLHEANSLDQRIGGNKCIGVKKQQISAPHPSEGLIVGAAKTDIDGVLDQLHVRIFAAEEFN